jgi:hypothetical protein
MKMSKVKERVSIGGHERMVAEALLSVVAMVVLYVAVVAALYGVAHALAALAA